MHAPEDDPAVSPENPDDRDGLMGDAPAAHRENPDDRDGLIGRVRVVEDQPLAERAAAYAQLHDELRTRLESGGGSGA